MEENAMSTGLYNVTVTPKQAKEIGICLDKTTVIRSDTFDLRANFAKIKSAADKQWENVREAAQDRRRNSNEWLEKLIHKT
jgi:hypothetical protein